MKHIALIAILLLIPLCILAEPTPIPTPVSDERIKVMVKEVATDILNNTLEGADQTKIDALYETFAVKFNVTLTQEKREFLFKEFCNIMQRIYLCNTKVEQEAVLNHAIAMWRITPL